MNKNELLVKEELEKRGFSAKKIERKDGTPDFLIDDKYYAEVKSVPNNFFTGPQIENFKSSNKEIKFFLVYKGKILFEGEINKEIFKDISGIRILNVAFSEEEHRKLVKAKGKKSWHDFILGLADKEV